ncbi:CASP C terminal-domain-containing protein [Tuber brumale]|nr:CASP C terminal-domain-containing protein [Tuber brumale]
MSSEGRKSEERRGDVENTAGGGDKTEVSSQTSAFQAAVAAWRDIDLTTLQKSLDATAAEIIGSQKDGLIQRKELAQKTKEYRKLDEEARKEEWKGLLKSYQMFIDHLSTSKKATENSFLSVYSSLSEAPDPYPLLEATIDSLLSLPDMQSLNRENSSLNVTVARLSGQVSNMEASIHAKNKELEKREREREEEVKKTEEVWRGVLDEKTRNWEGKEKALMEKLRHQESVLKEIKASYEVAQRMGGSSGRGADGEEDMLVKERTAELELVSSDLERTTLRLAEVEARNEQLRAELASAKDGIMGQVEEKKDEEDPVIARLQEQNLDLLRKVENARSDSEGLKREWERKTRTLERTVEALKRDNDTLKEKVNRWGDYEEVRRELEILKSIEFSTGDDGEDEDEMLDFSRTGTADNGSTMNGGKVKGDKEETLEQLLLARNKKLGSDLTLLRVSHDELSQQLRVLQQTLDSTTSELSSSRALNQKLEDDLLKFQQETQHSSAISVAGTYVSRYPAQSIAHGSHTSRTRISPASSIISGAVPHTSSSTQLSLESLRAGETQNAGILPMVTAQRDRFKAKNTQLEDELSRVHTTVSNLRQEVASLQRDNLQLYEKTRYIQSYRQPPALGTTNTAASSGFGANVNPSATLHPSNASSSGAIDRYRQAYESNISPFEAFRGRETARAFHRMGMLERMVYSLTRVVLANRLSRNLFVGYCFALHVLVFCVVWYSMITGADRSGAAGMAATAGAAGAGINVGGSDGVGVGAGALDGVE